MGFLLDQITASAVSFTVAGNSGISTFLTLFLLGILQNAAPDVLQMNDGLQTLLASWPALILTGFATVLEFVAMCVPVVDEITDSILMAIVPIVSAVATLGTFGLYNNNNNNNNETSSSSSGQHRDRELDAADSALFVFQTFMVVTGMGIAITMHLFKMLVRLIGEGWLTNILTLVETTWTVSSILFVVFIRVSAIFIAAILLVSAGWLWHRKCRHGRELERQRQRQEQLDAQQQAKQQATQPTTEHIAASLNSKQQQQGNASISDNKVSSSDDYCQMP